MSPRIHRDDVVAIPVRLVVVKRENENLKKENNE
jgi:hypothetical protein